MGVSVAVQVQIASQCQWRCNTWRKVSFEIQTTKTNILNTRRSVSFNIQTRGVFYLISKREECFIWYPDTEKWYIKYEECFNWYPNTSKSVSFDIQIPRSNKPNTRGSVSFYTQTTYISSTRPEGVLHMRMSVSSDIQTPRSNKSNMRRSVYTIFNHWKVIWYPSKRTKWIKCFCFVCLPFSVSYW